MSGCAALLASLLCHNLGHFTLVLSQPSTWYLAYPTSLRRDLDRGCDLVFFADGQPNLLCSIVAATDDHSLS